jgi:hypothetical protein
MQVRLHPQEIYLLERYSSLDYFAELRDLWAEFVQHAASCLNSFMGDLPPTYRSRPLPEQPDVVWGNRVLPNFRNTLDGLNEGVVLLSHGEVKGLHYAHGPRGDFKGQLDYSTDWMSPDDRKKYESLLMQAVTMAGNICPTEGAYWRPLALSNYEEDSRGPLNPPATWPIYRVNTAIRVSSGDRTQHSGVYVPDLENSCPQFLSTKYAHAPQAYVVTGYLDLIDPASGLKYGEEPIFEKHSCTWYRVEHLTDQLASDTEPVMCANNDVRVMGGATCPEAGYYFTPARADSRRFFAKGDTMPSFGSSYGATIWQWAVEQAGTQNQ